MKKYIVLMSFASLLPMVAAAQQVLVGTGTGITGIGAAISGLMNVIIPILVTISVAVIIFGIFRFILNAGDEEARKTGRTLILWGVVGIFLMLSVWGLVRILYDSIALDNTKIAPTNIF